MKNNIPDKQSNFLLYTGNDGKVNIEVFLKDETVWLTQKVMAELFGVKIPAIISVVYRVNSYQATQFRI